MSTNKKPEKSGFYYIEIYPAIWYNTVRKIWIGLTVRKTWIWGT